MLVDSLRTSSHHLDNLLPEKVISLDELAQEHPPPDSYEKEVYNANLASLGLLSYASLGPGGPEQVLAKLSELTTSFLGIRFDAETWSIVEATDAERAASPPARGTESNPCRCTSCDRPVYIEQDPDSPHFARWRLPTTYA